MDEKPAKSSVSLLVGIMLGGSIALIGIATWMIAKDQGSPVLVAVAGSILAAFAAIIASKGKTKS